MLCTNNIWNKPLQIKLKYFVELSIFISLLLIQNIGETRGGGGNFMKLVITDKLQLRFLKNWKTAGVVSYVV